MPADAGAFTRRCPVVFPYPGADVSQIEHVHAREIFDSRGNPTVEVEVRCRGGHTGRALVPSGASTGRFEAVELRDDDPQRLAGRGVKRAVAHVRQDIATTLIGQDAADQQQIDQTLITLDGTPDKSRLGANAILGTSLAVAFAEAAATGRTPVEQFQQIWQAVPSRSAGDPPRRTAGIGRDLSLPLLMVNMISGGLHAGRQIDFQDFLILPLGATSYRESFEWIVDIYHRLGRRLEQAGYNGALVGDEGGYGPQLENNQRAVELIVDTIVETGLRPGTDVGIGLDVASSHFYEQGSYRLAASGERRLSATQVVDLLESWVDAYPIVSIEDGLAEDDWDGWRELTRRLGHRVQLIGDDLFVTNPQRLRQGIEQGVGNSVLIKLNQIGTLSETLACLRLALDHDYWPVISARSGETEDHTIADLVVATGAGQLKVGSVARSERLAKYNHLLRLEERLGPQAAYVGGQLFDCLDSGRI